MIVCRYVIVVFIYDTVYQIDGVYLFHLSATILINSLIVMIATLSMTFRIKINDRRTPWLCCQISMKLKNCFHLLSNATFISYYFRSEYSQLCGVDGDCIISIKLTVIVTLKISYSDLKLGNIDRSV